MFSPLFKYFSAALDFLKNEHGALGSIPIYGLSVGFPGQDMQNVTGGKMGPAQSLSRALKDSSAVAFNHKFFYLHLSSVFGSTINNLIDYER